MKFNIQKTDMTNKKVDEFIKQQKKKYRTGYALIKSDSDSTKNSNPLKKESHDS